MLYKFTYGHPCFRSARLPAKYLLAALDCCDYCLAVILLFFFYFLFAVYTLVRNACCINTNWTTLLAQIKYILSL